MDMVMVKALKRNSQNYCNASHVWCCLLEIVYRKCGKLEFWYFHLSYWQSNFHLRACGLKSAYYMKFASARKIRCTTQDRILKSRFRVKFHTKTCLFNFASLCQCLFHSLESGRFCVIPLALSFFDIVRYCLTWQRRWTFGTNFVFVATLKRLRKPVLV